MGEKEVEGSLEEVAGEIAGVAAGGTRACAAKPRGGRILLSA